MGAWGRKTARSKAIKKRLIARVAWMFVVSLIAGMVSGPIAAAATYKKHQLWTPPNTTLSKTSSVSGTNLASKPSGTHPVMPQWQPATTSGSTGSQTTQTRSLSMMATSGSSSPSTPPAGSGGSYTATPLSESDKWSGGGESGAFTYSYPVQMPGTLGGAVPQVALSYNSGDVDGKTSAANGQASWVGDGWSYEPGFVERTYKPCAKDGVTGSADLCWAGNTMLSVSLPGHAGDIVRDDSTGTYRLSSDDGTTVTPVTGAANGAWNGEAWKIATTDGTTYYFGLNHAPGGGNADTATNSAFTEPVYSPNSGDPCYASATGQNSFCTMAWRWNLDFSVDPHGNLVRYAYNPETNYYDRGYGQSSGNGVLTQYTRGGTLASMSYGYRLSEELAGAKPAAQVLFGTSERCTGSSSICQLSNLQGTTGAPAVTNPGFESGNCTGWTCTGGAAAGTGSVHTGADALNLPAGASATQTISGLAPSTSYTVSAWGLGGGGCVTLTAQNFDAAGTTASSCIGSSTAYSRGSVTFTTGASNTSAVISLSAPTANTGPVSVDDVSAQISQSYWPDVPADENCNATGSCAVYSPTFWTTKMLSTITTQVLVGSAYQTVDAYTLNHSFPDPGDGQRPALWLSSVSRTATNGQAAIAVPNVSFYGGVFANRVPGQTVGGQGLPANNHYRLTEIDDETGASVGISYADTVAGVPACSSPSSLPTQDSNHSLCFPAYWTPPNQSTPILDWFNKYVVTSVTVADKPMGTTARTTGYTYGGAPAWHSNDSELTDPAQRVWDQWRGFGQVTVSTGTAPDPVTATTTTYLRGMNGDINAAGTVQTVNVTDSQGGVHPDDSAAAGFALETQTYGVAGGSVVTDVINTPSVSAATATHTRISPLPAQAAKMIDTAKTVTRDLLAGGAWRSHEVDYSYDPARGNRLTTTDDRGDGTPGVPEICTTLSYAASSANPQMLTHLSRTLSISAACGTTPTTANTVSDKRSLYDGAADSGLGSISGAGDATSSEVLDHYDGSGNPVYATIGTSTYDAYGRTTSTTDPNSTDANHSAGAVTGTAYTPATGALPTQIVTTNPLGWQATTTLDPGRGQPTHTVDANGNVTDVTYDALGRVSTVWKPSWTKAANPNNPSQKFSYYLGGTGAPSWTLTQTLHEDLTYGSSYQILNGFGDVRQAQTDAPDNSGGRDVVDTFYDSHGWTQKVSSAYYNSSPSSSTVLAVNDNAVPGQTLTTYDGSGRPTVSAFYSYAQPQWSTTTAYPGADEVDVTPPTGQAPTSTFTDARGHTTALWRYHTATATRNPGDADVTGYGYDATGRQVSMTDATGKNVWTTQYDLRGRKIQATDPDAGTTSTGYDADSRITSTTDGRGQALSFSYDLLGRKTGEYSGTSTTDATKQLAAWAYDSLAKGQLTSSTRYTAGTSGPAYVNAVTGYSPDYKPTGSSITIPAAEGTLAGTYTTTIAYTPADGLLDHTDMPAAGGLAAESVYYSYNSFGLAMSIGGNADYLSGMTYDGFGKPLRVTLGDMPNQAVQTYNYDLATARPLSVTVDKENGSRSVDINSYTYDTAGQIASSKDIQDSGATDLQCYSYDYAGRLSTAWTDSGGVNTAASPSVPGIGGCTNATPSGTTVGGPAPYWQTFSYDIAGNRTGQVDHDVTGNTAKNVTHAYAYPAAGTTGAHSSGSTTISGGATGNDTFTYDTAGNTVTRKLATGANQTLTWDAEGRLAQVGDASTGKTSSYVYDAAGGLLLQKDPTETVLYLDGQEIHLATGSNTSTGVRYVPIPGGSKVAEQSNGTTSYEFSNLQNTATTAINAATLQVSRRYFDPFGRTRGAAPASWLDEHAFLDKPTDSATGLDMIGARAYDANAGRFVSRDPLVEQTDPNQYGGYTYGGGDPVDFSDPTGMCNRVDPNAPCVQSTQVQSGNYTAMDAADKKSGQDSSAGFDGSSGTWFSQQSPSQIAAHNPNDPALKKYKTMVQSWYGPNGVAVAQALEQARQRAAEQAAAAAAAAAKKKAQDAARPWWQKAIHVVAQAAPVLDVVALATAEVPGLDAVTLTLATTADVAATADSAINTVNDLNDPNVSGLKTATDGLGMALGLVGLGGAAAAKVAEKPALAAEGEAASAAKAAQQRPWSFKAQGNAAAAAAKSSGLSGLKYAAQFTNLGATFLGWGDTYFGNAFGG
ncbi:RHS repeat-associated protein [Catenulispora sp. GAS73]